MVAGDDTASAGRGIYTAGTTPRWRQLGLCWALLITTGTATAMTFAFGSEADNLVTWAWFLPVTAMRAATNTVDEELGYRNLSLASGVLLATLLGVFIAKSMVKTGRSKWARRIHWLQDMVILSILHRAWHAL